MTAQLLTVGNNAAAVAQSQEDLSRAGDGERAQILVVDDENGPRQALRMLLKEEYDVHIASGVDAALDIIRDEDIDLIISDVRMPKKTGVDLLREAKEILPDVQVIMLTGYGQLETAVKAVEYGALSYMEKPFDNDAMLDMVEAGLEKYREQRHRRELEFLSLEANRFETLGRVVSGMMHDLGSPLTVLSSHLELLSLDPDKGNLRDRLTTMQEQVHHCNDMVRTTINFIRHDSKELQNQNLNDVVESCLQVGGPQLREHRIKLATKLSDDLPVTKGDLVLMRQAILNLITNACQALAGQPGDREISIRTWAEGGDVILSVADSGPGVALDKRHKIFDTFYTTKGKDGTGLGLSVVKSVMSQHKGSIELDTKHERGACFILRFPAL